MFETKGGPKNEHSNLLHLEHMYIFLCAAPQDLVRSKTDTPWRYFDADGE